MTAPNRSTLQARAVVEELARHGLRHVAIGSGSRSAPLVEAFTRDARVAVHPHVDERSAAFFALGVGAATGRPAAVVTTSGTAAANLLPAVVEASQSDVPLLVLTADRPARLRGFDANQTIDQAGLYGVYPRDALDLPVATGTPDDLRLLRAACARAWARTLTAPAGPVHVNLQFEKPLEPTRVPGDVEEGVGESTARGGPRPDALPHTAVRLADGVSGAVLDALAERIAGARRPVVACGPSADPSRGPTAIALARALGAPLLADPLSGGRFARGAPGVAVERADAVLARAPVRRALAPDLILRLGPAPTSAAVDRYLGDHADVPQLVFDRGRRWKDHAGRASEVVLADPAACAVGLAERLAGGAGAGAGAGDAGPAWREAWRGLEEAAAAALAPFLDGEWFEGAVAAAVAAGLEPGATFFIGNSMPIRDVDAFAAPRDEPVRALGFRGASGIDGNVSGALGAAAALGAPTTALLGDLTLLHDVGALLTARPVEVPVRLVVIQNRGGGIFHMLPIREHDPPFTRHIVMPQEVELSAVAAAARIPHRLTATLGDLRAELSADDRPPGVRLVEVPVDRDENWTLRGAALGAAAEAVAGRI